jgi:hypothetical protein
MRHFTMTMIALTAFAGTVATAQADDLRAAPRRAGDQCLRYSPGQLRQGRFGSRADCPKSPKLARPSQTCTELKSKCLSEAPSYGVPRYGFL